MARKSFAETEGFLMPQIPGTADLRNQLTKEQLDAYIRSKIGSRDYSEEKVLVPEALETAGRGRYFNTPEAIGTRAALDTHANSQQGYLDYLTESEPRDKLLRAGSTLGRGLASYFNDPSMGKIIDTPLTPEQKYIDRQKLYADNIQKSQTQEHGLNDYLKLMLSGKSTITDTKGFDQGITGTAARIQDNKIPPVGRGTGEKPLTLGEQKDIRMTARDMKPHIAAHDFKSYKELVPDAFDPTSKQTIPGFDNSWKIGNIPDSQSILGINIGADSVGRSVQALVERMFSPERHKLFGTALSKSEIENWKKRIDDRVALGDDAATMRELRSVMRDYRDSVINNLNRLDSSTLRIDREYVAEFRRIYGVSPAQAFAKALKGEPVNAITQDALIPEEYLPPQQGGKSPPPHTPPGSSKAANDILERKRREAAAKAGKK